MKARARDHKWKIFLHWLYRIPQKVVEKKKKEEGEHGLEYFYVEPL